MRQSLRYTTIFTEEFEIVRGELLAAAIKQNHNRFWSLRSLSVSVEDVSCVEREMRLLSKGLFTIVLGPTDIASSCSSHPLQRVSQSVSAVIREIEI